MMLKLAIGHFWGSLILGVLGVWLIPELDDVWFERVMIGLSFYAITVTAFVLWQELVIKKEQDEASG
jgi:hypothetical protein